MDEIIEDGLGESTFLVPFFNFFFYMGFFPFRIKTDTQNAYVVEYFAIQKIFCGITTSVSLAMMSYFIYFYGTILRYGEPAIVKIVDFVSNLSFLVLAVLFLRLCWFHQNKILQVIECTRLKSNKKCNQTTNIMIYAFIISGIFYAFAINFVENYPEIYFGSCIDMTCLIYISIRIVTSYCAIVYMVIQGAFIMLVISLRRLGQQFDKDLTKCLQNRQIEQGTRIYYNLKRKTDVIGDVYGNCLVAFYVTSVFYFMETPHILSGGRGIGEILIFVTFISCGFMWLMAAEFHNSVRISVLKWFQQSMDSEASVENRLRAFAIFHEITSDSVALSSKYFPITYKRISSVLNWIVTCAIVVLQLQIMNKD